MNNDENKPDKMETENIVEIIANGPIRINGNITLKKQDGTEEKISKITSLCRCGGSQKKPYCDGSHRNNGFMG